VAHAAKARMEEGTKARVVLREETGTLVARKEDGDRRPGHAGALLDRVGPPLAALALLLGLWKVTTMVAGLPPYLLPPPEAVLEAAIQRWPYLLTQMRHTVGMALAGYGAAAVVGISVAILFSQSRWIERSLFPYAILLQTTPISAIAPLIVLWFGIGDLSVMMISFVISLFPIIANSTAGLVSVDHRLLDLFRLYNARRWQELWRLRIPFALPYVFTGLRISAGLSVLGAVLGEYLVGTGGVTGGMGYAIMAAAGQMRTALLIAAIALCALLGVSFFWIVSAVGHRLLVRWHDSSAPRQG